MKNTNKLFVELTSEEASMISGGSGFGNWFVGYVSTAPKKIGGFVAGYGRRIARWFR